MRDKRFTVHTRSGKIEVNVTALETAEAPPSNYQWGFQRADTVTIPVPQKGNKRAKRTKRKLLRGQNTKSYM